MKATLYAKNGIVMNEVTCVRVTGIEGGFQRITMEDQDAMGKALGTADTSPHLITNMTLHVDGVQTGWGTPEPEDDTYQVSMQDWPTTTIEADVMTPGQLWAVCRNLTDFPAQVKMGSGDVVSLTGEHDATLFGMGVHFGGMAEAQR